MILANTKKRFQNNLIDTFEARNRLGKLNLSGERTDLLIEEWEIDKLEDDALPSKTDVDKWFKLGLITQDYYKDHLRILGYSEIHADLYIQSSLIA
ncbi:unnamed protein product, partial [marine sediment metagenome]